MTKVAKLVTISLMTRVLVEDTASNEEIILVSRDNFLRQIINELNENVESIVEDKEVPYDPNIELTPIEIKQLEKQAVKNIEYNGIEYPMRTLVVSLGNNVATKIVISTQSLSDAMGDEKEKFDTRANEIDNTIYYYVEDENFWLSAPNICLNHLDTKLKFFTEIR